MKLNEIKVGERYAVKFPAKPVPRDDSDRYAGMGWEFTLRDVERYAQEHGERQAHATDGLPAVVKAVGVPLGKRFDGVVVEVEYERARPLSGSTAYGFERDPETGKLIVDHHTEELTIHARSVLAPWREYAEEQAAKQFRQSLDLHERVELEKEWQQTPEGQQYQQEQQALWARQQAERDAQDQRHREAAREAARRLWDRHKAEQAALDERYGITTSWPEPRIPKREQRHE